MQPTLEQWLARRPKGKAPRKRIRKVSKRRQGANHEYSKRRKAFLALHPWCQIWMKRNGVSEKDVLETHAMFGDRGFVSGNMRFGAMISADVYTIGLIPLATDIHHAKAPRCKYLNDESTWFAASRNEHEWLHAHPSEARRLG